MRPSFASASLGYSLALGLAFGGLVAGCSKSSDPSGGGGGTAQTTAPVVGSTKPAPPMASGPIEGAKTPSAPITKDDGLLCDQETTDILQCEESFGPAGRCIMAAGDKGATSLKSKGCSEQPKVKGAYCCPQK